MSGTLFRKAGDRTTWTLLRRSEDFGVEELDLLRPPGRFWSDGEPAPAGAEMHVDARRMTAVPTPASMLGSSPSDGWLTTTRRSLARLHAWFLLVEDPPRRLEVQPIVTLAHQASVVRHIAEQPSLKRVLLADEVGLGKTIEAGLLIREVLKQDPGARILYLAPARLVRNVRRELDNLGLSFRSWVAAADRDATLQDPRVVASIHRAAYEGRIDEVLQAPPWSMIVVDECHHLSDWAPGGGKPVAQYKLVEKLAERLPENGRLLLMSGTPHQGHADRFKNIVRLLKQRGEDEGQLAGRVIYRTKEDVRDWDGNPLFPGRQVNQPMVVDLGASHQGWLERILDLFEPDRVRGTKAAQRRAAGWRAGQALQWATSSIQAGIGYLVRQAVRASFTPGSLPALKEALGALRPYRMGPIDEPIEGLFQRIAKEVGRQDEDDDVEDIEEEGEDSQKWRPDPKALAALLTEGVELLAEIGDAKWQLVWDRVLKPAGTEKVVLFAQPIETVSAISEFLERKTGNGVLAHHHRKPVRGGARRPGRQVLGPARPPIPRVVPCRRRRHQPSGCAPSGPS